MLRRFRKALDTIFSGKLQIQNYKAKINNIYSTFSVSYDLTSVFMTIYRLEWPVVPTHVDNNDDI